jgi:hypothetical protein
MPRFVIYDLASGKPLRVGQSHLSWRSLIGGEDLHRDFDNDDRYAPFEHDGQGIIEEPAGFDFYRSLIFGGRVEPDIDAMRERAEMKIAACFAVRINAIIGPLGALHALKRQQAEAGGGALVNDDIEAVKARVQAQDEQLAALDRARRALKARVRQAETAEDIAAVLAELPADTEDN